MARVTHTFDEGAPQLARDLPMPGSSGANVAVTVDFPEAASKRFGAVVESLGATPMQLVVGRAMDSNADGVTWAAGTSARQHVALRSRWYVRLACADDRSLEVAVRALRTLIEDSTEATAGAC